MSSKSFSEMIENTEVLVKKFQDVEGKEWDAEACVIELAKQLGDLSKAVMSLEGYYPEKRSDYDGYQPSKEAVADELSDILFMTLRLAILYGIDLEKEYYKQLEIAAGHEIMKQS